MMLPYNKCNLQCVIMTNTVEDTVHVKRGQWLLRAAAYVVNHFLGLVFNQR